MQHGYSKSLLNVLKMAQKHQEPGKTYARNLWRQYSNIVKMNGKA
jgi:hypothetical protein